MTTEYPTHVNDFRLAELIAALSIFVRSPHMNEGPINFECTVAEII
jgi:hypothetical protein